MATEHIGTVGRIEVHVSATSEPWALDIDSILVSVAASGFGELGNALARQFPRIPRDLDLSAVTSSTPRVLPVADHVGSSTSLRWLVLVNVRENARGAAEGQPTLDALRRAVRSGLVAAAEAGATRIGLPLLGTGVIGMNRNDVVIELWQAVVESAAQSAFGSVQVIEFFDRTAQVVELVRAAANDGVGDEPAPDWSFVVTIDTLGSQGPSGPGVLLNDSIVLTSTAVANRQIPLFAVEHAAGHSQAQLVGLVPVTGEQEELVVLRLLGPTQSVVPGFSQVQPGDRCELPAHDADGRFTTLQGIAAAGRDGLLVVDLDQLPVTDGVRSGCPAIVDGLIAGIVLRLDSEGRPLVVPLTDVAGELAEWAPEVRDAVWPVTDTAKLSSEKRAPPPTSGVRTTVVPLSARASRLLSRAAQVADARSASEIEAVDVVVGAMVDAASGDGDHSANALYACVPDTPSRSQRVEAALGVLDVPASLISPGMPSPGGQDPEQLSTRAASLLQIASLISAATTGEPQVRQRHLVAAALGGDVISQAMASALGVDSAALRRGMRSYISRKWPNESPAEWDRALAEPDLDLAHRFDGDQVLTWARRHQTDRRGAAGRPLNDQLNVQVYATMLATLIARRSTADSLSIGLFGEWGSGKTTFMELIQREVEQLTDRARAGERDGGTDYVTDIVPIWFNAWHYADANLWASLAAELFDQLLGPRPDLDGERRKLLRAELEQGQRRAEELKVASHAAQERAGQLKAKLADAERRRVATRGRLDATVLRRIAADQTVKDELLQAARDARLDQKHLETVTTLARDVAGAVDDLDAIRKVLRRRRWTPVFVATLLILLLLATAVAFQGQLRSLFGGLSIAGVAVVVGQIGLAVKGARAALGPLRRAAEKADEVEQRIIDQPENVDQELAQELVAAEGEAAVLAAQLGETLANAAALEGQLQDLTPGSRLYSFIAARASSSDYRSQLGIVSTIRRDFDQLSALMADWRHARATGATNNEAKRPIDRIVLYIDDLDRCEPDQVVAVLQAVNLLVAMDLFIVIVGVDPRWLLRSLHRRYRSLLGPAGTRSGDVSFRESTPQDYLEKIFQVPFVLPGLGADGLGRLLHSLVTSTPRQPTETPPTPHELGTEAARRTATPATAVEGRREPAVLPVEHSSEVAAAARRTPEAVRVTRDVTVEELALLSRLHQLVRTPRSAKRLFNVYRLLRSTRDLRPAARFLGSDGQPGEYQAVAILLGVLTAYPEQLGLMLWGRRADGADEPRALCKGGGHAGWRAFVRGLRPRAATPTEEAEATLTDGAVPGMRRSSAGWMNDVSDLIDDSARAAWVDLVDALEDVLGPEEEPFVALDEIDPYRLWGPRVARFSFVLSAFAADDSMSGITPAGDVPVTRSASGIETS